MIALSLAIGTATPISIADAYTGAGYVLGAYSGGRVENENALAESRWLDGASLTSTRKRMATVDVSIQAWGTSYADMMSKVAALGTVLDAPSYTVSRIDANGTATQNAMPATYEVVYNYLTMRQNMAVINASIPVQPA